MGKDSAPAIVKQLAPGLHTYAPWPTEERIDVSERGQTKAPPHLNSSSTKLGVTQGSVRRQTLKAHLRVSEFPTSTSVSKACTVFVPVNFSLPNFVRLQA